MKPEYREGSKARETFDKGMAKLSQASKDNAKGGNTEVNADRSRDAYYYAPPAQSRYVRLSRIRLPPWVVDGLAKSARYAVCGPAHVTHLPDTEFGA